MPGVPGLSPPPPDTSVPGPPGSATVPPATRCPLPGERPHASSHLLARFVPASRLLRPGTADREDGSAGTIPTVPLAGRFLLLPVALSPHAARLPFYNASRNPMRSRRHSCACGPRELPMRSGRRLPTPRPEHSAYTADSGQAHESVRGLTALPSLPPPRRRLVPLPTAARLDRYYPGSGEGASGLLGEGGVAQV